MGTTPHGPLTDTTGDRWPQSVCIDLGAGSSKDPQTTTVLGVSTGRVLVLQAFQNRRLGLLLGGEIERETM